MSCINKAQILIVSLLVLSLGLSCASLLRPNKGAVVTINKGKIVTQFAKELNSHSLSKEKFERLSKRFAKALKSSIEAYAKDKQVVVIDEKLVQGTGVDVSEQIMRRVVLMMRGGK